MTKVYNKINIPLNQNGGGYFNSITFLNVNKNNDITNSYVFQVGENSWVIRIDLKE